MAGKWSVYIAHRWRIPKAMWVLIVLEFPLTVAALALFGIADPNTYRTKLWQNGSDQGFNSDPISILYEYANYEPVHVPLIWQSFTTQFNVVISVVSMFIMLVKATMYTLHTWIPILSVFVHCLLVALYAVALRNQATPDLTEKNVSNLSKNLPWYLEKGCSYATKKNHGYCMQARASFGVTIVMLILFIAYLAISLHSAIITPAEKAERQEEYDEEIEMKRYDSMYIDPSTGRQITKEEKWEQNRQMFMNLPKTPVTPFGRNNPMTPRTTAFTQLSGDVPESYAMGEPSAIGRGTGPSRPLPFREYSGDGVSRVPNAR